MMVDQITTSRSCSVCGVALGHDEVEENGLCRGCAGSDVSQPPGEIATDAPVALLPDPDHPHWGPVGGISVWLASVAAIVLIPAIAVVGWYLLQGARGVEVPALTINGELNAEFLKWAMSPPLLLVQISSTIVAHAITFALCWMVVSRLGTRPFWQSLGWHLGGRGIWYWIVFSACLLLGIGLLSQVLSRFISEAQSPFDQLLGTSLQVRIAVVILATLTAPTVEEIVYRGILFSSLRNRIGLTGAVITVTLTFAGVHVIQNVGAWVSMSGLALLSLTLTVVRARTKSVLPCIIVHTVNNAVASVLILLNKAS